MITKGHYWAVAPRGGVLAESHMIRLSANHKELLYVKQEYEFRHRCYVHYENLQLVSYSLKSQFSLSAHKMSNNREITTN